MPRGLGGRFRARHGDGSPAPGASRRTHRRGGTAALLVLAVLAAPPARAEDAPPDPFESYLEAAPRVEVEDLLDVSEGDPLDRVLAVIHNPEAGIAPTHVRVQEVGSGAALDREPAELQAAPGATWLVTVTQACDSRVAPGAAPASWLVLRDGALVAWDLQVYDASCASEEERFEASDHEALRHVGRELFRRQRRGRFRYGPLRYREWEDAFAAPTPTATLALLRDRAVRSPEDPVAQHHLAVALWASGEREAALDRLRRAVALDPDAPEPHLNLARIHRQRGEREAAARERALAEGRLPAEPVP